MIKTIIGISLTFPLVWYFIWNTVYNLFKILKLFDNERSQYINSLFSSLLISLYIYGLIIIKL